jgi:uncharacterized protein
MQEHKITYWIEKIIIGLDLCPFAKIPYEQGKISVATHSETSLDQIQSKVWEALENLHETNKSSALVFFPNLQTNFEDFYEFISHMQEQLDHNDLSEHFQLVCFHPEFYFAETKKTDKGNYVNRSPYPMVHVLLSHEITLVTQSNPAIGEEISLRNQKRLETMDENTFEQYFSPLFDLRGRK